MLSNHEKLRKKPYKSPNLFVYGDIREITKNSSGPTKNFDNFTTPDSSHKTNT